MPIIKILLFLLLIVFLIIVLTGIFIGAGYILSLLFSLTLFQASILCIGASFVLVFILFTTTIDNRIFKVVSQNHRESTVFDADIDENEYEEEMTDDIILNKEEVIIVKSKKVGRNDPCPCGSGKKHKFCCGIGK